MLLTQITRSVQRLISFVLLICSPVQIFWAIVRPYSVQVPANLSAVFRPHERKQDKVMDIPVLFGSINVEVYSAVPAIHIWFENLCWLVMRNRSSSGFNNLHQDSFL